MTDHPYISVGAYFGYLDRRPDSVVAALRAIGEADGAVVVHCAAGKDGTGTIVGRALLVVGVTPDAVIADHAASAERLPRILERLAWHPAYAANLERKTVAQQEPRAETMRLLVEALDREGGSLRPGPTSTAGLTRTRRSGTPTSGTRTGSRWCRALRSGAALPAAVTPRR